MMAWIAEAEATSPWWLAAIVLPLAAFCAYLVRYILSKYEKREEYILAHETAREVRENKRAEQTEMQTKAMQEVVNELRRISDKHDELAAAQKEAFAELPERLAALQLQRRPA